LTLSLNDQGKNLGSGRVTGFAEAKTDNVAIISTGIPISIKITSDTNPSVTNAFCRFDIFELFFVEGYIPPTAARMWQLYE
jgi:hypothetical protein